MDWRGYAIRRERLRKNWSQEGLCRGICAVSYLSKIEKGRAEPTEEILVQLMERLGLPTDPELQARAVRLAEQGWEALLYQGTEGLTFLKEIDLAPLYDTATGLDLQLLSGFLKDERQPLDTRLEACMTVRQLALQRLLQQRAQEACGLFPCGFTFLEAGTDCYIAGDYLHAMELLQMAYDRAAQEGAPRLMLLCRCYLGNICSNRRDLAGMEQHYKVARRLANALHDQTLLSHIAYNTAATDLEIGRYQQAYDYFAALVQPDMMDLHKLSIACEKTGRREEALQALDRAAGMECRTPPTELARMLCDLVRFRLEDDGYLEKEGYGQLLQRCFDRCRRELPAGYAAFHLPWMLEWLTATRQYKKAFDLMCDFS